MTACYVSAGLLAASRREWQQDSALAPLVHPCSLWFLQVRPPGTLSRAPAATRSDFPDLSQIWKWREKQTISEFFYSFRCTFTLKNFTLIFFQRFYIFIFRERGEGNVKERERNIDVLEIHQLVASHTPPTGDLAHNPGVCPDWASKRRPFSLQAGAQSTESHGPGQNFTLILRKVPIVHQVLP